MMATPPCPSMPSQSPPPPPLPPIRPTSAPAPSAACTRKSIVVPLPLALPTDPEWLSPNLCLLREQLEVFAAAPEDIAERKSGKKPALGTVGLRCRRCARITSGKSRGAVVYPKSISLMHQAVRNFHRYHFFSCEQMPDDIKEQMRSFKPKENQSKRNSAQYWIQSCRDTFGMIDSAGEEGEEETTSNGSGASTKEKKTKTQPHIRFRDDNWAYSDAYSDAACSSSSTRNSAGGTVNVDTAQVAPAPEPQAHSDQAEIETSPAQPPAADDASEISLAAFDVIDDIDIDGQHLDVLLKGASLGDRATPPPAASTVESGSNQAVPTVGGNDNGDGDGSGRGPEGRRSSIHSCMLSVASVSADDPHNSLGGHSASGSCALDILGPDLEDAADNDTQKSQITLSSELTSATAATADVSSLGTATRADDAADNPQTLPTTWQLQSQQDPQLPEFNRHEPTTTFKAHHQPSKVQMEFLSFVQCALEVVKNLRAKHNAAANASVEFLRDMVRNDLYALGGAFYQNLSGVQPPLARSEEMDKDEDDAGEQSAKRDRMIGSTNEGISSESLSGMGFPVAISLLVDGLLNTRNDDATNRFHSASQVETELRQMISNPERYLFDIPAEVVSGHMDVSVGRLYGRDGQKLQLMQLFARVITTRLDERGLLLIYGKSGTGKTSLMNEVRTTLCETKELVVSSKFDSREQPMSVICRAFDDYFNRLLHADPNVLASVKTRILKSCNVSILMALIPSLELVVDVNESSSPSLPSTAGIVYSLRMLVRAIASPAHPVLLLLDDLQWADGTILELTRMVLTDMKTNSLLVIGCYRSNEVDNDDLRQFVSATSDIPSVVTLSLGNLDKDNVNALVSDTLHLPPRITCALSAAIYAKTRGNPLFVVQLMKSLHEEKLLFYSPSARCWEWDMAKIKAKGIANNVVDLMLETSKSYSIETQWILQVASCLGARFSMSIMKLLEMGDGDTPSYRCLDRLVEDGLILVDGSDYRFAHDQIRESLYECIPPTDRQKLHLQIGRKLQTQAVQGEDEDVLIVSVDQLQLGVDLITDHQEKIAVARLFLWAGKKSFASSAFLQASIYFLQGTALLAEEDWVEQYDLSLELFTSSAEAQVAIGNHDGVSIILKGIFSHSRCLHDTYRANLSLLRSIGDQGQANDAINFGLRCLAQVGETFPADMNQAVIMTEISKSIALVQNEGPVAMILNKSIMTDETKVYVMKLLGRMCTHAYLKKQEFIPLAICRMVQITLKHGLNVMSPDAFACLGMIMCGASQGVDGGYRFGQLAMALIDKVKSREFFAHRVHIVVYGLVNILKEPLQACVEKLIESYKECMFAGDLESAMRCACSYVTSAFQAGCNLQEIIGRGKSQTRELTHHNIKYLDCIIPLYVQASINLAVPCDDDPTSFNGEAMNEEDALRKAIETEAEALYMAVYYLLRMWLAYLFGRYDVAADMMEKCNSSYEKRKITAHTGVNKAFYSGLVAMALAHEQGDSKWKQCANESLEQVRRWSVNSSWNFLHKEELLTAETLWLDGDYDGAMKSYDAAIASANRHRFVNEEGVANERAGIFVSKTVSYEAAKPYFARAHNCYLAWGATAKADFLVEHHGPW